MADTPPNPEPGNESVMEFPCTFPIKVMGLDTPEFRSTARQLVEKHAGPLSDDAIHAASSRTGRYVSMTFTVQAESRAQLDAIYLDLTAHADVLTAL